jgi:hypothetical protein
MKVIITEESNQRLITESILNDLGKIINELVNIGKKSAKESDRLFKLDVKFLLTWSSTIAGFIGPLNSFIKGENPELSESDVYMISLGVTSLLFYNNVDSIKNIYEKIKEKKLSKVFESALKKGNELQAALFKFLESIGLTVSNALNIASFTFLIPILGILITMIETSNVTLEQLLEVGERLVAARVTSLSSSLMNNLIKKLFEKVKN